MKNKMLLICLVTSFSLTGLNAQKWGLGGSLPLGSSYQVISSSGSYYEYGFKVQVYNNPLLRIPVNIAPGFALEPEFGFIQFGESYASDDGDHRLRMTNSAYIINVYWKFPKQTKNYTLYPAIIFGVNYIEVKLKETDEFDVETDINADRYYIAGLVYGGEYYLSPQFSLGGEAQITYLLNDYKSIEEYTMISSTISTSARFVFRWYIK